MPCAVPDISAGCGPGTSGTTGPRWRHSSTVDPDGDVAGCPRRWPWRPPGSKGIAHDVINGRPSAAQCCPDEILCRTLQLALGGTGACLGGASCRVDWSGAVVANRVELPHGCSQFL